MNTWKIVQSMSNDDGLYCTFLNGDSLSCLGNHYTFGASADSAYEYMLKQWILNSEDTVRRSRFCCAKLCGAVSGTTQQVLFMQVDMRRCALCIAS
jgi:hypothetical protein